MKQLSHAEKQQPDARIEEGQEQVLQDMNPNTPEESKIATVVTRLTSSDLWKYGLLAFILCLLAYNLFSLFKFRNFGYDQYGFPMIALMLLFNHIAYYFPMKGRKGIVMKTVAWAWIVLVCVYTFWIT